MADELLPCPHCGQPVELHELRKNSKHLFIDCGCQTALVVMIPKDKRAEGIAAWNTRK